MAKKKSASKPKPQQPKKTTTGSKPQRREPSPPKNTPPAAPAAPAPAPAKPTPAEMDDLLGAPAAKPQRKRSTPTITPASQQTQPAPHAPSEEDLLGTAPDYKEDAKAKPVKQAKCRHTAGGEVHLYDRTKGAPPFKAPQGSHMEYRWLLMHVPSGMALLQEKKRPARKLMVQAARGNVPGLTPAGATFVAEQRGKRGAAAPGSTQAPAQNQPVDEDFNKKSEGPHAVPSVWVNQKTRYGLLVYVGRTRAKMVTALSGSVAVEKIGAGMLGTQVERDKLVNDLRALGSSEADNKVRKDLEKQIEAMWLPDSSHTPEHYAKIMVASTLLKTDAARAYLDRILGQMDELLLASKAAEEDLLS